MSRDTRFSTWTSPKKTERLRTVRAGWARAAGGGPLAPRSSGVAPGRGGGGEFFFSFVIAICARSWKNRTTNEPSAAKPQPKLNELNGLNRLNEEREICASRANSEG